MWVTGAQLSESLLLPVSLCVSQSWELDPDVLFFWFVCFIFYNYYVVNQGGENQGLGKIG